MLVIYCVIQIHNGKDSNLIYSHKEIYYIEGHMYRTQMQFMFLMNIHQESITFFLHLTEWNIFITIYVT